MKHLLIAILFFVGISHAADPVYRYEGEVAGVMCSACSGHVQAALKKIEGVQSVTVLPAKDGGVPRLEITATNAKITRDDCVKALGEQAKMYDVRNLKPVAAK